MTTTPLEDLRFWAQMLTDAQRTVLCPPRLQPQLDHLVDQLGIAGIVTVQPSQLVPADQIYVVDEHALEASFEQAMQRITPHGLSRGDS